MASDLSVVNGARVSFARRKDEMDESDEGLIRFLMRDRHGTPFEHNAFRFHIRCPIFVAREWMRHRVGSFNEFSLRYAKATDDFYVPEPEDVRTQVGKPGAYTFEPVEPELAERDPRRPARGLRARLRDLRAARRARRRARGRALRAAGRRLHRVLLDGQRALADELRLAPRGRDGAARDPPLRGGGRAVLRASTCRSRTRRSSRTTASRPRASSGHQQRRACVRCRCCFVTTQPSKPFEACTATENVTTVVRAAVVTLNEPHDASDLPLRVS